MQGLECLLMLFSCQITFLRDSIVKLFELLELVLKYPALCS